MPTHVQEQLGRVCQHHFKRLVSSVRFSGWGRTLSDAEIEDAVAWSFLAALDRPEPFARAIDDEDFDWVLRRLRLIAKRKAKDVERRSYHRSELGGEHLPTDGRQPAPPLEELIDLQAHLEPTIEEAVRSICPSRADDLVPAVRSRILLGGSDTAWASRYGVTRESLNRCRRYVERRLLEGRT